MASMSDISSACFVLAVMHWMVRQLSTGRLRLIGSALRRCASAHQVSGAACDAVWLAVATHTRYYRYWAEAAYRRRLHLLRDRFHPNVKQVADKNCATQHAAGGKSLEESDDAARTNRRDQVQTPRRPQEA
eukprot:6174938-Pleurochrysis_carterae.AAC.1